MLQIQGNGHNKGNPEDFQALRTYVWAKALWNPNLNVDNVIKEFVEDYYGKAAPVIMEYLAFRDKVHQKINVPFPCYTLNSVWISDEDIIESLKYISRAEALADSEVVRKRIETLQKVMEYMIIVRWERMLEKKLVSKAELQKISADWIQYFKRRQFFSLHETWKKENNAGEIMLDKMELFSKGIGFERGTNNFIKSIEDKKFIVIEEVDFYVNHGHKFAKLIEDKDALNSVAIEIPPTGGWAVTFREEHYLLPADKNYDLYIAVKLTKPSQGKILNVCHWRGRVIFEKFIDASQIKPEYSYIHVGKVNTSSLFTTLPGRGYTFLVSQKKDDGGKLIVDHVVLIETK